MELVQCYMTRNPCYQANIAKVDSRYVTYQKRGPLGGMLHSVGCAQPSAKVFINGWNKETYTNSCVHGIIDANDGIAYNTLPWGFRGWHGGGTSNNTHLGVEMCESKYIRYVTGTKFEILDRARAVADCVRAYHTAVELFAMLAAMYKWNVDTDIISHKEGYAKGIATNHGDPEHYWQGLGMPYTMDGFRADVKQKMEENDMTKEATEQLIETKLKPINLDLTEIKRSLAALDPTLQAIQANLQRLNNAPKALLDNDAGKWSAQARQKAIDKGIIAGVGTMPDGTPNYAWESPITREQFMVFLDRLGLLD